MMNVDAINLFIINELKRYGCEPNISTDINLFLPEVNIPARNMAALFISISDRFSIDLDRLIPKINEYTITNISQAVITVLSQS